MAIAFVTRKERPVPCQNAAGLQRNEQIAFDSFPSLFENPRILLTFERASRVSPEEHQPSNYIDQIIMKEKEYRFLQTETIKAVDLGISCLWADRNLGASNPEDYGDYFAWGETMPKQTYDWENYKWSQGSKKTLLKYNYNPHFGSVVDNKLILDLEDDPAYTRLGSGWRTPTSDEFEEMVNACRWEWTERRGIAGYVATSRINGNSIFLPKTGVKHGTIYNVDGGFFGEAFGSYRTNEPAGDIAYLDTHMIFDENSLPHGTTAMRCTGLVVRPIYSEPEVLCVLKKLDLSSNKWWICKCERQAIPIFRNRAKQTYGNGISFYEVNAPCLRMVKSDPDTLYGWGGNTYSEAAVKMASFCGVPSSIFDPRNLFFIE